MQFIRRQRASRHPFLDLELFRCQELSGAFAISVAAFFVNFGTFFLIAQYLQLVMDLGPARSGLWMMPPALGFIAGSFLAPKLTERLRAGNVIAGGFVVAASGLGLVCVTVGTAALIPVVAGGVILALGLAPIIIITADLIIGAAPPERAGVASGLSEASTELGGAFGIALLGSLVAAVYRGGLSDGWPGALVQNDLRRTLGELVRAPEQLPDDLAVDVVETGRAAFVSGMQTSAAVAAIVALGGAVLAIAFLRNAGTRHPAPLKSACRPGKVRVLNLAPKNSRKLDFVSAHSIRAWQLARYPIPPARSWHSATYQPQQSRRTERRGRNDTVAAGATGLVPDVHSRSP